MPDRIPTFKPPWVNRRPKRRDARPSAAARGYCSKGWKLTRAEVLVRDAYQCQSCGAVVHGRNAHVDHIVRKSIVNSDKASGLQTLCSSCHSKKTVAEEKGEHGRWSPHPSWIPRACIPVTLVCGTPAAGKNTYIDKHKGENDLVIDVDEIASGMAGSGLHAWGLKHLGPAMRRRNEILAGLHKPEARKHGRAWLIAIEPEGKWRQWWVDKLGCDSVVVIATPAHVCDARIMTDPDRSSRALSAREWWASYTPRHGDSVLR